MRFNLLSDADWDSKISVVLSTLTDFGYRKFFEERDYGNSIDGISVFFICCNPGYNFKRRVRHSKKEKKVYMDIMLDLYQFREIEQKERERIVAEKMLTEIPAIIGKYKFDDFNLSKFETDLSKFLKKTVLVL